MSVLLMIDREIVRLKGARDVLAKATSADAFAATTAAAPKKKHPLTPEGRKRIADAVKRRWAAQKRAAK